MKCPICSFETGHYVCSRAPVISLVTDLERKNKLLLDVAKFALTIYRAANNKTELWEAWVDNLGEEIQNVVAQAEEKP